MQTISQLRDNKPLQLVLKSGGISFGGIMLALVIGLTGWTVLGHKPVAAWADAFSSVTSTYTYTSGNSTVTVTTSNNSNNAVNVSLPDMSPPTMPTMPTMPNVASPAPAVTPVAAPAVASSKLGLNDPPANVPPSSDFPRACYTASQSKTCDNIALTNINRARAAEGLGPMVVPDYYYSLPLDQQIVVVTNLERTARGLSASKGPDQLLNPLAQVGAVNSTDPVGPRGYGWASNWAIGEASALAIDFSLMYDDGIGSSNIDCSASAPSGCWGHRRNILSNWQNSTMGIGIATVSGSLSVTQLFVENW